jgi:hypothetical protein
MARAAHRCDPVLRGTSQISRQVHRTDRFPGVKGAVRKGISHSHVDLPLLVSVQATGVSIPTGNSDFFCKSPGRAWSDADVIALLNFRKESPLSVDLNVKGPVGVVKFKTFQARICSVYLLKITVRLQCHNIPLTIFRKETVTCSMMLCSTKMSDCQMSLSLLYWTQITYQLLCTFWIILGLATT